MRICSIQVPYSLKAQDVPKSIEFLIERDLTDGEKEKWLGYFVVPVRKSAHIIIYFVLGFFNLSVINVIYPS